MREESPRCAKCLYYCRAGTTFLFSHIGLCGLVVGYTIMGAFTFEALEAYNERAKREEMQNERTAIVEALWDITAKSSVLHEVNWTQLAAATLRNFEVTIVQAVRKEGYDGKDDSSLQWSFSGALLYSIIVITTIGYGNIAPKTPWGKLVTLLYAIVGIPLMLLCLSNIGDAMAQSFKFIYWKVCCYLCIKPHKKSRRARSSTRHIERYSSGQTTEYGRKITQEIHVSNINKSSYYTASGTALSDSENHCPTPLLSSPIITVSTSSATSRSPQYFTPGNSATQKTDSANNLKSGRIPVISNKYVCEREESVPDNFSRLSVERPGLSYSYSLPLGKIRRSDQLNLGTPQQDDILDLNLEEEDESGSEGSDKEEEVSVPIWLCSAIVIGYICGGAFLFTIWEDWNFLDSSYFCFVTLTTIGFGDLVPGTAVLSEDAQLTLGLCALYLLFGMALLAMSFNLVQEEVTKSVKCIGRRIGILPDEEDDN
ncbi:potassium channel subfamily K member 18-like [Tachypleus tridentatus]|uniref:potassium channel subfamily K member 18-like n=1 Tax=Tachypleus tridentatus TaxID=6853 RepID=UPI003FD53761